MKLYNLCYANDNKYQIFVNKIVYTSSKLSIKNIYEYNADGLFIFVCPGSSK